MYVDLSDFKSLIILVDCSKNIAMFPKSRTKELLPDHPDGIECYGYFPAYVPTELSYPYNKKVLAEKLELVMGQWCQFPCLYETCNSKKFLEGEYYGTKSFRTATKGKKMIYVGWNGIEGKYVSLLLPCKSGKAYLGIISEKLSPDADWEDFAEVVINLIEKDLSTVESFKVFKRKLNL